MSTASFADFHSPGTKAVGTPYEYVNLSNALSNEATVKGATGKYEINNDFPWIEYKYSGSTTDNGKSEVARGGVYVSKNPIWGTDEFVYMVDDAQKWLGSPKVEVGYTKNADGSFNLLPKTITFGVMQAKRVDVLLTGGGSNTNVADIIVMETFNRSVVKRIKSDVMPGKSNKNNAANTNSQYVTIDGLNPLKSYMITVAPAASAFQVEKQTGEDEFGDPVKEWVPFTEAEYLVKDIPNQQITNVKGPAVYVTALRLYGTHPEVDTPLTPNGNSGVFHATNKIKGLGFDYVNLSNALRNDAPKTTFDAEGNGTVVNKYAINDQYNWINYNYSGSVLNSGACEVSRGGVYVSKDPVTGEDEFVYMTDDGGLWLGSPKVEVGWIKNADDTWNLLPKTITLNIKEATGIDLLLTGGGSNTNVADIFVIDAATQKITQTITTGVMPGKSNKASAANTKSEYVTITDLDPAKSYFVTVAPAASATQVEVTTVDEFGDNVKVFVPYTATENFLQDVPNQVMSNIKSPAVYVTAARIYNGAIEGANIKDMVAEAKAAKQSTVTLVKGGSYELNEAIDVDGITIQGNGATIKVGADAQFYAKGNGMIIDGVVIDAKDVKQPIFAMATDALVTAEDSAAFANFTMVDGAKVYKYEAASQNVLLCKEVTIKNSTVQNLSVPVFSVNGMAWGVEALNFENNIIGFATAKLAGTSSQTAIDFFTNKNQGNWSSTFSVPSVKDLKFVSNTIYNTVANTGDYFFRFSNASNALKVWGANSVDGVMTVTMQNNTFNNVMGTKDIANNMVTNGKVKMAWNNNIFFNVFRLQNKFKGNYSLVAEGNLIDAAEGYNLNAGDYGSGMGTELKATGLKTTIGTEATKVADLAEFFAPYESMKAAGDQRWASYAKKETAVEAVKAEVKSDVTKALINGQVVITTANGAVAADGKTIK